MGRSGVVMCQTKDWNCFLRTVVAIVSFFRFEAERDRIKFKFRKIT